MQSEDIRLVKVVINGDSKTGKSSLLARIVNDEFYDQHKPTIGVEFKTKTDQSKNLKLQIWDTAGQERFKSITAAYYRGAGVFVIVFDVTNRASFENVGSKWLEEIKAHTEPDKATSVLLVGNKTDLNNREVSLAEAEAFALNHHMMYLDFSSKDGRCDEAFEKFAEVALKSLL